MSTGWVILGYAVSYGAIAAYVAWMAVRIRSTHRYRGGSK